MLRASRDEALTDALTGLGNRRALTPRARRGCSPRRRAERPLVLALFDLDGFKHYNDTFGHPGGRRAARPPRRATSRAFLDGRGNAFRMGGDEFCALFEPGARRSRDPIVDGAAAALSEHGDGFWIGCSLRRDRAARARPTDAAEALRIADQRMYAAEARAAARSAGRQSKDVLLRALAERDPSLGAHIRRSSRPRRGDRPAPRARDQDEVETRPPRRRAARRRQGRDPRRDPRQAGPARRREWAFVRRHTLIGERIIAAAPALGARRARSSRSSHERWDGAGYPDGLAGDADPARRAHRRRRRRVRRR